MCLTIVWVCSSENGGDETLEVYSTDTMKDFRKDELKAEIAILECAYYLEKSSFQYLTILFSG